MRPLGISKAVLLGELSRAPQVHCSRDGRVRALLSLMTRVHALGAQGDTPGAVVDDAHLVYCEGSTAERMMDVPSGALVYLEGRNREQRMTGPGGKSHRLAFVSASIVRQLSNTAAAAEGANAVTLLGTVAEPAVTRYSSEGKCESITLRVLTTDRASDDSGDPRRYAREYHCVTFFGRLAEFVVTHGQQGSLAYIEGRNQSRRWQDDGGISHRTITVIGHYFQLLYTDVDYTEPPERNLEVAHGYDVRLPEHEMLARQAAPVV